MGSGIRTDDFTCSGGTPTKPCVPPSTPTTTGGFGQVFKAPVGNAKAQGKKPTKTHYGAPAPVGAATAAVLTADPVQGYYLVPVGAAPADGLTPTFT